VTQPAAPANNLTCHFGCLKGLPTAMDYRKPYTPAFFVLTLILTLSLVNIVYHRTNPHNMPTVQDFLNLTTILRFVAPSYTKTEWQEIDSELKGLLSPIHFGLANNVITPQDAGSQFTETLTSFLQTKPEFVVEMGKTEGYQKHTPKTLQQAKNIKKDLRKKIQQKDATPEDRKMFGQSVRYHNFLLKEQCKRDTENSCKHQEKMFHENFWEFSKKVCKGNF
jgi:hypothetical protein